MSEPARDEREAMEAAWLAYWPSAPHKPPRGDVFDKGFLSAGKFWQSRLAAVEAERDRLENQLYTEQHERDTAAERRVQELEQRLRDLSAWTAVCLAAPVRGEQPQ